MRLDEIAIALLIAAPAIMITALLVNNLFALAAILTVVASNVYLYRKGVQHQRQIDQDESK
jgi:hypothetical protein